MNEAPRTVLIRLRLRSPLGTPLAGDTLWGHVAWGVRWRDGEDALSRWLEAHERNPSAPPLALADPAPAGFVPVPHLPSPPPPARRPSAEEVDRDKAVARRSWMPRAAWSEIAGGLSPAVLRRTLLQSGDAPHAVTAPVLHAAINRLTGGTAQEGGGTLFATTPEFHDQDAAFDAIAVTSHDPDDLHALLDVALSGGYGRDGGTGRGAIDVEGVEPFETPVPRDANAVMTLGPCVPRTADPLPGHVRLGTRAGRLGGDFAVGPTPDGGTVRQKRPVRHLLRGSVLRLRNPEPPPICIGRIVAGVHDHAPIRQAGITPVLPCRLVSED